MRRSTVVVIAVLAVGCATYAAREGQSAWGKKTEASSKAASGVEASNHSPGTAYVAYSGLRNDDFKAYVYTTTDYGTPANVGRSLTACTVRVKTRIALAGPSLTVTVTLADPTWFEAGVSVHRLEEKLLADAGRRARMATAMVRGVLDCLPQ